MRAIFQVLLATLLGGLLNMVPARAGEVHVAVASNFTAALDQLARRFESSSGNRVLVSAGSTGKLYVQIKNGAPFDVLLAADSEHPQRMETEKMAVAGTRFTYAVGKLVLWSPRPGMVDGSGNVLSKARFRHLAIANPKTAPYGEAAVETLQKMGLWEPLQARLVQGENIGQTFQYVATGNAELGFVSLAQVKAAESNYNGSYWLVPATYYNPIIQQAVLLEKGRDNAAASDFLKFLRGKTAQAIIEGFGYTVQ